MINPAGTPNPGPSMVPFYSVLPKAEKDTLSIGFDKCLFPDGIKSVFRFDMFTPEVDESRSVVVSGTKKAPESPEVRENVPLPRRDSPPILLSMQPTCGSDTPAEEKAGAAPLDTLSRQAICDGLADVASRVRGNLLREEEIAPVARALSHNTRQAKNPLVASLSYKILEEWIESQKTNPSFLCAMAIPEACAAGLERIGASIRSETFASGYWKDSASVTPLLEGLKKARGGEKVDTRSLKAVSHLAYDLSVSAEADIPRIMGSADGTPDSNAATPLLSGMLTRGMGLLSGARNEWWDSGHTGRSHAEKPSEEELARCMKSAPAGSTYARKIEMARKCGDLLTAWWGQGQIEVVKDGIAVRPGTLDLTDIICNEKIAARGGTIELASEPGEPSSRTRKETKALLDKASATTHDSAAAPFIKELGAINEASPKKAAETVNCMICSLDPRNPNTSDERMKIGLVLMEAAKIPWLKDLFAPHIERLKTLRPEQGSRDSLYLLPHECRAWASLDRGIVAAFPEKCGMDYIGNVLIPMLKSREPATAMSAKSSIYSLWDRDNSLVAPSLKALVGKGSFCTAVPWEILTAASERGGWTPDREYLEGIISMEADVPEKMEYEYFKKLDSEDFKGFADMLDSLEKKHPGILDDLEMPDGRGVPVPLKTALLGRALPEDRAEKINWSSYLTYAEGSSSALPALFSILSRDPAMGDMLLSDLEGSLNRRNSESMVSPGGKKALAGLGIMTLSDEQSQRLNRSLSPWLMTRPQDGAFNSLLDVHRKREMEKISSKLQCEDLTVRQVMDLTGNMLAMHYSTSLAALERSAFNERLAPLEKALASIDDNEGGRIKKSLLESVKTNLKSSGGLASLTSRETADFHMLYALSRKDPGLNRDLRSLIAAELEGGKPPNNDIAGYLIDSFRHDDIEESLARLSRDRLTRSERMTLSEDITSKASLIEHNDSFFSRGGGSSKYRREMLSALREGLSHSDPVNGLGDMPSCIDKDDNLITLYSMLAPGAETDEDIAPAWHQFREIVDILGGLLMPAKQQKNMPVKWEDAMRSLDNRNDPFQKVADVYSFVEEKVAEGESRENVLSHVLKCYSLGEDPRKVSIRSYSPEAYTGVEMLDDDVLQIDGLTMKVRRGQADDQ